MLLPDARKTAFEVIRPPSGYRLDFAVADQLQHCSCCRCRCLAYPDGGLDIRNITATQNGRE